MAPKIPEGRGKRGSLRSDGGGLAASKGNVSKTTSGSALVDGSIDAGMDKAAATVSKAGLKGKVAAAALKNEHVRDAVKNVAGDKIEQVKDAAGEGLAGRGAEQSSSDAISPQRQSLARGDSSAASYPGQNTHHAKNNSVSLSKPGSLLSPNRQRGLLGRKRSPGAHAARAAAHVATAPLRFMLLPIIIPLLLFGIIIAIALGLSMGGDDGIIEEQRQFIPIVNIAKCEAAAKNKSEGSTAATPGGEPWDGTCLSPSAGRIDGPSGSETFYDPVNTGAGTMDGVVELCQSLGIQIDGKPVGDFKPELRDDGVWTLGGYVMCATDESVYPRGSKIPTSMGPGIALDTGVSGKAVDIACDWRDGSNAPADFDSKYKGKYAVSTVDGGSAGTSGSTEGSDSSSSSTDYSDTLIIGDSITDDWCTGSKIDELMPGITRDSVSSRTIHDEGPDEGTLYHVEHADKKYKRYVIETGNNEGSGDGLTEEDAEKMIGFLDGKEIYFVTIYVKTSNGERNTQATLATIDKMVSNHSNVHKIDWYSICKDHVDEYLGSDVCHPSTDEGKQAYAECVKSGLGGAASSSSSLSDSLNSDDPCNIEEDSTGSSGSDTPFDGEWCFYDQSAPNWDTAGDGCSDWTAGCGVVSVAMVLSSYAKDSKYTPTFITQNDPPLGSYFQTEYGGGSALLQGNIQSYVNDHQDIFHLKAEAIDGTSGSWIDDWDRVEKTIQGGGAVVIGAGSQPICGTGHHYVVVRKIEGDTVTYADPWGGSDHTCTKSEILGAGYTDQTTTAIFFEKV